jgi:hypothetical protein
MPISVEPLFPSKNGRGGFDSMTNENKKGVKAMFVHSKIERWVMIKMISVVVGEVKPC